MFSPSPELTDDEIDAFFAKLDKVFETSGAESVCISFSSVGEVVIEPDLPEGCTKPA